MVRAALLKSGRCSPSMFAFAKAQPRPQRRARRLPRPAARLQVPQQAQRREPPSAGLSAQFSVQAWAVLRGTPLQGRTAQTTTIERRDVGTTGTTGCSTTTTQRSDTTGTTTKQSTNC